MGPVEVDNARACRESMNERAAVLRAFARLSSQRDRPMFSFSTLIVNLISATVGKDVLRSTYSFTKHFCFPFFCHCVESELNGGHFPIASGWRLKVILMSRSSMALESGGLESES